MMEGSTSGRPANMMPFMDAMKSGFKNSFTLSGRASRSEYWYWVLGGFIFQIVMIVGSLVLAIIENNLPIDQIRNRILNNRIVTTPDFEMDYLSRLAKKIYDIKFEKIQNKEKTFKEIFSFDKFKRFEKKIRDFIEEE